MSQTLQTEKKTSVQVSHEVQEEFVNAIARNMLALAETAGKWKRPWNTQKQVGMPFCPATGREYGGANMVNLLLTSMVKGYDDDRWLTFKQLQKIQADNPGVSMKIQKGEKGVKLLRPEEVYFTEREDGTWKYLTQEQIRKYKEEKAKGHIDPDVQQKTLFYPFTVFNASQIDGFPEKEYAAPSLSEVERNEFLERFIACSGVAVDHYKDGPCFRHDTNVIKMPYPEQFRETDDYYASKLHEFFHATGHESREKRQNKKSQTIKGYAFEEMRAEMFSLLAGARLDLPMPESNSAAYIKFWNQTFSDGDARAVFQAASEAAKMLSVLHQFEVGEEPRPQWFPRRTEWPELMEMQKQRDAAQGVNFREGNGEISTHVERPAPPSFTESVEAFRDTDNLALKARLILQNSDFLNMALKEDPEAIMELATLCDRVAQVLYMEVDAKLQAKPNALENPVPLIEQQAASAQRMRM